ncbi:hypothetical protein BSZ35_15870 [Salinibacter sp. 10B]|uniref:DUF92 domain-containing protein n=1 Tax=Salinibacter sp. 10B TaxID=1923971 RepID=UPI000CF37E80|nr:DUF92 domain-containing protein [Salinibacter sp. 10B]PQJ35878.1 hypothetical protein BSZ35_15870 [Salinibacter sp. 10B]
MTIFDALVLLGAAFGIGGLVAGGEGLRRMGVSATGTRRIVHAGVCVFVAAAPWAFSGPGPLYLLAGGFVLVNAGAWGLGWWPSVHAARPSSWGTIALPAAVLPALAVTWSAAPSRIPLFQIAFLVVGLADPVAAWVGQQYGQRRLTDSATLWGILAFAGSAFLLVTLVLQGTGKPLAYAVSVAVLVAVAATTVEAISQNGWDNLTVVIAILSVLVPVWEGTVPLVHMAGAMAVGAGVGAGAWWAGTLDGPGASAGALFAASLVGLGGAPWAVPALAFFVLSSALSALPARDDRGPAPDVRRTLRQVMANGGGAWALLLICALGAGGTVLCAGCYAGFLGALASAAADTWATEVGTRYAGRPVSLIDGMRVSRGASGAISVLGTVAALLGAATVALAAHVSASGDLLGAVPVGGIIGAGLIGMGCDSLVGATLQAQYAPRAGTAAPERPATPTERPVRGWGMVDNDVVNGIGSTGGAIAAVLFWLI